MMMFCFFRVDQVEQDFTAILLRHQAQYGACRFVVEARDCQGQMLPTFLVRFNKILPDFFSVSEIFQFFYLKKV